MMDKTWHGNLERRETYKWVIPKSGSMRVEGVIYADEKMCAQIKKDNTPLQVANVATLPGIVKASIAMPDIHWGYGFPIGGVAAMDISKGGVISPGGVGSDINCGVRLLRTNLRLEDIKNKLSLIIDALFRNIPSGLGSKGKIHLTQQDEDEVLAKGAEWAEKRGYGTKEDLLYTEEFGSMPSADPDCVSKRAKERGKDQLGTLGSGNHFLELQVVEKVYDEKLAKGFNLEEGQITIMIHTGSRGLGYQVCEDYVQAMGYAVRKYGISLVDRQLACAPFDTEEGRRYFKAMSAAANYAWCNRQCIMHWVREVFEKIFNTDYTKLGIKVVYDVAHNIAKIEEHIVDGKKLKLCVHRKGATRAFPAGHMILPKNYLPFGQPVIVPGDMGTNSYVLVGTEKSMEEVFGSACHGAGRVLSRAAAIKLGRGRAIDRELAQKGIIVKSAASETLSEEMPEAYKNVTEVVTILHNAGISKLVAKLRPLGVVKG